MFKQLGKIILLAVLVTNSFAEDILFVDDKVIKSNSKCIQIFNRRGGSSQLKRNKCQPESYYYRLVLAYAQHKNWESKTINNFCNDIDKNIWKAYFGSNCSESRSDEAEFLIDTFKMYERNKKIELLKLQGDYAILEIKKAIQLLEKRTGLRLFYGKEYEYTYYQEAKEFCAKQGLTLPIFEMINKNSDELIALDSYLYTNSVIDYYGELQNSSFKRYMNDYYAHNLVIPIAGDIDEAAYIKKGKFYKSKIGEKDKKSIICFKPTEEDKKLIQATIENNKVTYKKLILGMNREDIPASIQLIRGSKMSDYDKSFQYKDNNYNLIKIGRFYATVTFVISDIDNKVKHITYEIKNVDKLNKNELKSLVSLLTKKPLKFSQIGKVIKYEYKENIDGLETNIYGYYGDKSTFAKGTINLTLMLTDINKSNIETQKIINQTLNQRYITVKNKSFICSSLSAYKKLFDNAERKLKSVPSQCLFINSEMKFAKTANTKNYKGRTIVQIIGRGSKFYWVWDNFIKK